MTLSRPDDEGLAAIPADEFTALLEHENALARHQETGMMRNPCSACGDNDRFPTSRAWLKGVPATDAEWR